MLCSKGVTSASFSVLGTDLILLQVLMLILTKGWYNLFRQNLTGLNADLWILLFKLKVKKRNAKC